MTFPSFRLVPWFATVAMASWWITQSTGLSAIAATPSESTAFLCQVFQAPLEGEHQLETSDRTSAVGQWVASNEKKGWRTAHVDFEVSQKASGFPVGFVQVCMSR